MTRAPEQRKDVCRIRPTAPLHAFPARCYSQLEHQSREAPLEREWDEGQPIYRQLRDRVVAMILEGALAEGDPLPSVRTVAAEYRVNPLTVLKAYQNLADEELVEKRRGVGMFVNAGARKLLMQSERRRFLAEEWPRIRQTIERLELSAAELLAAGTRRSGGGSKR